MSFPGLPLLSKHTEELSDQVDRRIQEGGEQEELEPKAQTARENKRADQKSAVRISFQFRWF